ncbi:hypothetical protein T01_2029 [Trichinella spiralis]|uniref:Uncharacterized protein n=1 Tax=Trichinella spiralis TaxID=6334 RepID=A0A0V1AR46_TRISP|nr:hypothetical protein T01_2029 [Trichinella spiralis]
MLVTNTEILAPVGYHHIKEYERFLGMQTLVSSNIYQYCGFLPVFLRTETAPRNMSGCSVCKLWRVIPPTNIPDLFLCFYAQKSANCSFVLSVTAADMSKPC